MNQSYSDITNKLGVPLWWDEVGCPRYSEFHPGLCNNIYAKEACLFLISCQACGREFQVAESWDRYHMTVFGTPTPSLDERIKTKTLYYRDPPNIDCCPAGPTMTSNSKRVIQFWKRDNNYDWVRDSNFEISLKD